MLYGGSMGFKFKHVYNWIIVMVMEKNMDFEESLGAVDHLEGSIMRWYHKWIYWFRIRWFILVLPSGYD